jgi:hypothetical protein
MTDLFGLSTMASNTQLAPLALLGYRWHQRDFFGPLREPVQRPQTSVLYTPYDKLLTCLVSIMSGCQAVCQIDTRIRPERALAQAWGLENFAQPSTVADTLECFTDCGVQQLRTATGQID